MIPGQKQCLFLWLVYLTLQLFQGPTAEGCTHRLWSGLTRAALWATAGADIPILVIDAATILHNRFTIDQTEDTTNSDYMARLKRIN